MSDLSAPQPQATPPKRVKKRIYLPLVLILLLVGIAVAFYVRGVWADMEEKNPAGPEIGTVTQLLDRDGRVEVRTSVVVNASPRDTWAVISDYPSHPNFVPYVARLTSLKKDDGRIFLDGVAHSSMWGEWPFQSLVTHHENERDGVYVAEWSEEDKDVFAVNRGRWHLKPIDKTQKQTLLAFSLQVELKQYPSFIVRNVIMDRVHTVVKAMRDETIRRKQA